MENKTAGLPFRVEDEVRFDAAPAFAALDKRSFSTIQKAAVTPSVKNCEFWQAQNTGAVTITNFIDGQPGQRLYILGDGQTTLQHGTKMFMQGGADLLLAASRMYLLVYLNSAWYQI